MTANLTDDYIDDTYKSLLHLDNDSQGLTSSFQQVYDGDGTSCPLYLSYDSVKVGTASFYSDDRVSFTITTEPAAPAAGQLYIYAKSDKHLYIKDSTGTETDLTSSGSGGLASVQNQSQSGSKVLDDTNSNVTDLYFNELKASNTAGTGLSVSGGGNNTAITFNFNPANISITGSQISDATISAGSSLSGSNTGDQDLSAYAKTSSLATVATTGAYSDLSGAPTIPSAIFKTIAVSGQSDVVADSSTDTLTLVAGTNVTITTDAATDSITINSSGSGGGISNVVEDLTPQLGGDLDLNGNQITSPDGTDYIDIPNGTIDLATASTSRMDITDSGVRLGGANARVTTVLDEDNMASDSATALATQQSIKAYVDTKAAGYQPLDADLTTLSTAFSTASASGAAYLDFAEDTDNGTNRVRLQGAASTADVTVTLPASTGTIALTSDLAGYQPLDSDLTTLSTAFTTASASGAASLKFHEDTDNGTNAVTLQGPASTADVTITLPATAGTIALTSDITGTNSGTNTGDQNLFKTISVSGQSDVVADSTTDTLTLVAGTNMTITTDASTDTITFTASSSGGGLTIGKAYAIANNAFSN